MIKRYFIIQLLLMITFFPAAAQTNQQDLKREVTLYNPYKPSLPQFRKKSFLPDVTDTATIRPDFKYEIIAKPYTPEYAISPIKAASLLPDPLPKLYKSYLNFGFGNYVTPLFDLSITNERSKKGSVGFNARHFSTNGKLKLDNNQKVFAGYMDNDLSLFAKRFFRKNVIEGSLDFSQKLRYAYGYDTSIVAYEPGKKQIKMGYNNFGSDLSFASVNLDSTNLSYNFNLGYNYFYNSKYLDQHNIRFQGIMSKSYQGFYVGSGIDLDFTHLNDSLSLNQKYIVSVSPFVKKSTPQWNFKAGLQILLDKNMTSAPDLHLYPDVSFGLSIVPSYIGFFAALNGRLEKNSPEKIIVENPFIVKDGILFKLPNTDHILVISTGLRGNNGIGGNYLISGSYSMIGNMLFYKNYLYPDLLPDPQVGNLFLPVSYDVELLKLHGEMSGLITDKISYMGSANYYSYTLPDKTIYPWNKPSWDGMLGVKYNLRDKILAGIDVTALGKRKLGVSKFDSPITFTTNVIDEPVHVNLNLSAEYRYTKILSIWIKFNNISFNRYYEWAFYPSERFLCLVGFTYSL
jgi:hypothetical protein